VATSATSIQIRTGVPPGLTVGLAGMDEAAGREDEAAELSIISRKQSSRFQSAVPP